MTSKRQIWWCQKYQEGFTLNTLTEHSLELVPIGNAGPKQQFSKYFFDALIMRKEFLLVNGAEYVELFSKRKVDS